MEGSTQDLGPAVEAIYFVSVHPVQNVEESIESQSCNIVRGNVFNDSHFVQHYDLRNEGQAFKPQTITPDKFPWGPARLNDAGQNQGSWQKNLEMGEVVSEAVIGLFIQILIKI